MSPELNLGATGGIPVPFAVIIAAEFLVAYLFVKEPRGRWALSLVLLGGALNIFSRVSYGGVQDNWNFFGLFYNNLADYLIVIGIVLYGYRYFVRR